MKKPVTWIAQPDSDRHLTTEEVRLATRLLSKAIVAEVTSRGRVRRQFAKARVGFNELLLRAAGVL